MDMVNSKELFLITLQVNQTGHAKLLQKKKKISNITSKNSKMRSNLPSEQKTTFKKNSQSTDNKVYTYHKGKDYVILNIKDVKKHRRTNWKIFSI